MWVIIDTSYLCWRAHHTTGTLSYKGTDTGVLFGVFRDILTIRSRLATDNFIFAFDVQEPTERRKVYPEYKKRTMTVLRHEVSERNHVRSQREKLLTDYLPRMGYANLFAAPGYEADDLIATTVQSLQGEQVEIVSGDKDLYQLLSENVSVYRPDSRWASTVSLQSFREEYKVEPSDWPMVRALAGDKSDNIPGIEGIGEVNACKFIRKELTKGKFFERIVAGKEKAIREYLPLVRLPYPGTPEMKVKESKPDHKAFRVILEELGMMKLLERVGR